MLRQRIPRDPAQSSGSTSALSHSSRPPVSQSLSTSSPSGQSGDKNGDTAGRASTGAAKMEESQPRPDDEQRPLLGSDDGHEAAARRGSASFSSEAATWSRRNQWIVLALASGACAAFNGVFAKLTTTELTSSFSHRIAALLGLSAAEKPLEILLRGGFFGLNLAFNGVMWTLFTSALARGNSTTQVSVLNTSANFMITAILGLAIFSEALPPLWWLGAALLVAGTVIVGRKDEGPGGDKTNADGASTADADGGGAVGGISAVGTIVDDAGPHVAVLGAAAEPPDAADGDESFEHVASPPAVEAVAVGGLLPVEKADESDDPELEHLLAAEPDEGRSGDNSGEEV